MIGIFLLVRDREITNCCFNGENCSSFSSLFNALKDINQQRLSIKKYIEIEKIFLKRLTLLYIDYRRKR